MRWMVLLLLVVILGSIGLVAEPFAPVATLHSPPDVIGRDTVLRASATDRGTGLAHLELRLVPQNATSGFVLASEDFPRRSFRGSGVGEASRNARNRSSVVAIHLIRGWTDGCRLPRRV